MTAPYEPQPGDVVVHLSPSGNEIVTPCCSRTVFELPRSDRITLTAELVTCKGRTPHEGKFRWETKGGRPVDMHELTAAEPVPAHRWTPEQEATIARYLAESNPEGLEGCDYYIGIQSRCRRPVECVVWFPGGLQRRCATHAPEDAIPLGDVDG